MRDGKSYNVKIKFKLPKKDRKKVKEILSKGAQNARVYRRALILLKFHYGGTSPKISKMVEATPETVRRVGWAYLNKGLEDALYDAPRPGAKRALDTKQGNRIIAMVCSDPPKGYAQWSLRLIAKEAVKRRIVGSVGRETIRLLLKTSDLKPWREKNVVYSET